jgi:Protein of unknown function (DUF1761)
MSIALSQINYWAVLVAGFVTFFLGGLWYTALFGQVWVKLHGYSPEQVAAMKAKRPPAVFFGGMIACYLLVALVVAVLLQWMQVDSALHGVLAGTLLWLGPAAAIAMTAHIASDKPLALYGIDASFQLLFLALMGAILGGWR